MLKLIDQTVCLISDAEKGNCPLWVYSNRDKQIDMGQRSRLDSQSKYTMLSKQNPRIKTQRLDPSFTRSPSKSNLKLDRYLTITSITMVTCKILIRSHPPWHFFHLPRRPWQTPGQMTSYGDWPVPLRGNPRLGR